MERGNRSVRTLIVPVLLLAIGLLGACGGGGGGGGGSDGDEDNDLIVVKFQLVDRVGGATGGTGSTNAFRNNRIRVTFSAPVERDTVSDRTIQIGIPSGTNLFLTAQGSFGVDGNEVLFDPTVTETNAPNPFGFEPNSVYSVTVKGLPDAKTVQSVRGKQVLRGFSTTFTTTDQYLPDLDQPRVLSIEPQPDAVDVASSADIVVEFSEAMLPATFDPDVSFRVINLDRGSRDVFGQYRFSDDARSVTFRPTFGFGRGPYRIQVDLTVDLSDLAGNSIANPQQWTFTTIFDPTAVNEGLIEEFFDDSTFEDTSFSPSGAEGIADWNPATDPGMLASTFGTRTITVPTAPGGSSNYIPLGGLSWNSCRFQSWYKASELGNAGTISGLSFFVGSVLTQGAVLTNFTVQAGHTSGTLQPGSFASNLNVGNPVTLLNGVSYTMPSNMVFNQPAAFPALQKSFGFNGTNNLVIDLGKSGVTGNGTTWSCRSGFDGNVRRMWNTNQNSGSSTGSSVGYTYPYVVSFRTERSMAQSLWYRAESNDPTFLDSIVSPTEQPPGTETTVVYQGAHDDGTGVADPATITAWTSDVTELAGYQHVRFQAAFTANLATGVGPKLEEIVIPYIFF